MTTVDRSSVEPDAISADVLADRRAVVTGASGGIGRAIATRLASRGVRLYLVGRERARLDSAVRAARGVSRGAEATVVGMAADLTDSYQVRELADEVERELGGLDVLVHAAGTYQRGELQTCSAQDLDGLYRANVRAPYEVTQATLGSLARCRGDIVFINSTQGLAAGKGTGGYAATQHAMKAVAESLRAEANNWGVRVTMIHLGRTATDLQESIFAAESRAYAPELLVQPGDVADVVVSVVSLPKNAQVTSLTLLPTHKA